MNELIVDSFARGGEAFRAGQGEIFEPDNASYHSLASRIGVLELENGKWLSFPFAVDREQFDSRQAALRSGIAALVRKARRYMRNGEGAGTHWSAGYAGRVIEWALSLKAEKQGLVQVAGGTDEAPCDHPVTAQKYTISVQFSGGAASYVAAKLILEKYGHDGVALIFADTLIEDEDLYRFLDDAEHRLQHSIIRISEGRDPWSVFFDERMMGNSRIDPCSRILKRKLLDKWRAENCTDDCTLVIGYDASEDFRFQALKSRMLPVNVRAPLLEQGVWKEQVYAMVEADGLRLPRLYKMGFSHNNCGGFCVKAGQASFALLLENMPGRYAEHEAKEEEFRKFIGKDVSIMRDRRGGVSKPLTMRAFRERHETEPTLVDRSDIGGCLCMEEPDLVAADADDRVIEDSPSNRSGGLKQITSDTLVAALLLEHRARKIFPGAHVVSMTNATVNGQFRNIGTCTCGAVMSHSDYEHLDAAIEAHWQKFDHLTEKVDGGGQPIDEAKKPRKQKSNTAPEGIQAPLASAPSAQQTAGGADATNPMRTRNRAAAKQNLEVAEAGIDVPVVGLSVAGAQTATSETMDATAGETAPNSTDEFRDSPLIRAALDLAWREEPQFVAPSPGPVAVDQLNDKITLYCGSCLDALPLMAENSLDACVTDPPYHLTSGKKGGTGEASMNVNSPAGRARITTGFMGKAWDGGDVAFQVETWRAVFRVLKPGAHLIAFSGTRTYHRMVCAIEDAGFEIRDQIGWLYGSGFPKSLNVSKALDKQAGADREVLAEGEPVKRMIPGADQNVAGWEKKDGRVFVPTETAPATEAAKAWDGWGTALKPAQEPIVVARKPLSEKTVAANVLKWRTGAINVDGCRVVWLGPEDAAAAAAAAAAGFADSRARGTASQSVSIGKESRDGTNNYDPEKIGGRWPANVIHDGSEEVLAAFPSTETHAKTRAGYADESGSSWSIPIDSGRTYDSDEGSAARFFYTAKADDDDRIASKHPTVKPVDLMQYLTRLVTPPNGIVLDPFAGTGTTADGAFREGFSAVLIEREAEYQDDIRRRARLMMAGPEERAREMVKHRLKDHPLDPGPLFGGRDETSGGGGPKHLRGICR